MARKKNVEATIENVTKEVPKINIYEERVKSFTTKLDSLKITYTTETAETHGIICLNWFNHDLVFSKFTPNGLAGIVECGKYIEREDIPGFDIYFEDEMLDMIVEKWNKR